VTTVVSIKYDIDQEAKEG